MVNIMAAYHQTPDKRTDPVYYHKGDKDKKSAGPLHHHYGRPSQGRKQYSRYSDGYRAAEHPDSTAHKNQISEQSAHIFTKDDQDIIVTKTGEKPLFQLSFCNLYMEDLLLIGLILVLLFNDSDELLLFALIYLFLSGLEKKF